MSNDKRWDRTPGDFTVPGGDVTVKVDSPQRETFNEPDIDADQRHDAMTQKIDAPDALGQILEDNMTRIVGAPSSRQRRPPESLREKTRDAMNDPPSGWLVIVDGPGKGNVLTIRLGMNSIGRSGEERICLDFGDNLVSRRAHATVTYDTRGRKFYVQQGGGTNLVYLQDEVVLTPKELPAFSELLIGRTKLRFVPLCGESFDWQDLQAD